MKTKPDEYILDRMSKDPGNWKGPFYYNRKDPRLLVPKFSPALGATFNFASPYVYVIVGAVMVLAVLVHLFT